MGLNPGSPGFSMPPAEDDAVRRARDMERTIQENAAARTLAASQVGNGGTLKIDGSLQVTGTITVPGTLSSAGGFTATSGNVSAPAGNVTASGAIAAGGVLSGSSITSGSTITAAAGVQGTTGRFDAGLYSTDAYSFNITGTRVTGWHQIDGHIATASSSERFKTNIVDADLVSKAEAILDTQISYYSYKAEIAKRDDPDSPEYVGPDYKVHTEIGMIAERLHEAGLWEFVVYERDVAMKEVVTIDEEGNETTAQVYAGDTLRLNDEGEPIPYSIHYEIWSVAVHAATQYLYRLWKADHAQIEKNTADIAALKALLA